MASSRNRTIAALMVTLVALAVMIGALWPREAAVRTDAERADHIAQQLRCPFCNGESIADATAQVARDLEVVILEQVASGMSNEEIYQYFADRYGESLLLSPPLLGWGWALWVLPLAALVVGVVVVARRLRGPGLGARVPDHADPSQVESRLEAVARDRADIARQLKGGELDLELSRSLNAALETEEAALTAALTSAAGAEVEPETPRFRSRRALAGTAAVVIGAAAVTGTLIATADDGGDGGVVDAPPIDLASVTTDRLEEVVAANPDVVEMRIVLGQMLMEEGEVLRAAQHFNEVLQREDNPQAMAWLGWISFLAREHDTAEGFLVDALSLAPDYPQAQWWLANVRFLGLDDPAGALEPLEALLASPGVPDEVRVAAQDMLARAKAAL